MSEFQRFAIFYLPEAGALAKFGASWLGWDVEAGEACAHPPVKDVADYTTTPRKYGFHGTLKPPFRLAGGTNAASLRDDLTHFAATRPPVQIDGLALSKIGKFLALVPIGDTAALADLAFACVREFDHYRRPADAAELERRRAAELTPRQDNLLLKWGYPYVADEFRFHLTLTSKLDPTTQANAFEAIRQRLPDLQQPYPITSVSLAGERQDGRFQLIQRYALTG